MALAPQEPWIFSDSLKENILVGKKPADKYMSVLDVCALQPVSKQSNLPMIASVSVLMLTIFIIIMHIPVYSAY